MAIRNRANQIVGSAVDTIRDRVKQIKTFIVSQIYSSQGNVLIGRISGPGLCEEIQIGSGLTLTGNTLSSTGSGSNILISETAPLDLTKGWFDPTDGVLAYYIGGGWVTQGTGGILTPDGTITFGGDTLTFDGDTLTFTT